MGEIECEMPNTGMNDENEKCADNCSEVQSNGVSMEESATIESKKPDEGNTSENQENKEGEEEDSKPEEIVYKAFVGNLPENTSIEELTKLFEPYGPVLKCEIVKRWGFVQLQEEALLQKSIEALNNTEFKSEKIAVEVSRAKPKSKTPKSAKKGVGKRDGNKSTGVKKRRPFGDKTSKSRSGSFSRGSFAGRKGGPGMRSKISPWNSNLSSRNGRGFGGRGPTGFDRFGDDGGFGSNDRFNRNFDNMRGGFDNFDVFNNRSYMNDGRSMNDRFNSMNDQRGGFMNDRFGGFGMMDDNRFYNMNNRMSDMGFSGGRDFGMSQYNDRRQDFFDRGTSGGNDRLPSLMNNRRNQFDDRFGSNDNRSSMLNDDFCGSGDRFGGMNSGRFQNDNQNQSGYNDDRMDNQRSLSMNDRRQFSMNDSFGDQFNQRFSSGNDDRRTSFGDRGTGNLSGGNNRFSMDDNWRSGSQYDMMGDSRGNSFSNNRGMGSSNMNQRSFNDSSFGQSNAGRMSNTSTPMRSGMGGSASNMNSDTMRSGTTNRNTSSGDNFSRFTGGQTGGNWSRRF